MSQENVEIVRTAMESFNLKGVDAIAEQIHPDFETTTPPSLADLADASSVRGKSRQAG